MNDTKEKYCVNCKHFIRAGEGTRICAHPALGRCPVTGAQEMHCCYSVRDDSSRCGMSGEWFEQKEAQP
jgi:hypothetical protein